MGEASAAAGVREADDPVVAFVFARGGSQAVPRKNLQLVDGVPLVGRAVAAARACDQVDRVVVSTDDAEIAEVARAHGAEVPWSRPAALAGDTSPEWLSWQHALAELEQMGTPAGLFVSVPATSPLRTPEDVAAAIDRHRQGDVDIVVTASPARRHPGFNMVRIDERGHAHLADEREAHTRRQEAPPLYDLATVAYVASPDFVARADGIFAGRVGVSVVSERSAWDIDTPFDLEVAQLLGRSADDRTGWRPGPAPRSDDMGSTET